MFRNKKYVLLFFALSLFVLSNSAQTPFYTFLNGWRGAGVTEVNGNIVTVSNYQENLNGSDSAWLKINKVSQIGNILSVKNIGIDSSFFEDANALGYGSISFEDSNNWMLSNYNTYTSGKSYRNIYRFSNNMDTVNKSLLISLTGGTNTNGALKNIKYINDTNIILVGQTTSSALGRFLRVISTDTSGSINWQTNIASLQPSIGTFVTSFQIATAADGGYFVTCVDRPDLPNIGDDNLYFLLVKLDKNGSIQWKKRITDGVHTTNPGSIIQKDSNSYIVTWAESWLIEYPNWIIGERKGLDSASVWMGEIDLQGNFKWKKSLYNTAINCDTLKKGDSYFPYNIIKLSDGNFLLCVDHFMNNATYVKVTPDGEVIWNRKIVLLQEQVQGGLLSYTNIKYTKEALDGGILGVGEYYSDPSPLFPTGMRTSLLIKLDQYGCMEPGCHLEGCTDPEALNYNPEAVYDCGCVYDPCPEGHKVTIAARHFKDLALTDFKLYKSTDPSTNLLELDGTTIVNEEHYNQSICVSNDCEEEYILHIDYHRTIPPNSELPFASDDPYKINYFAYFHVNINDSTILDIGGSIFSDRDTTFRFKVCTPEPIVPPNLVYNLYPNPAKENITLKLPDDTDFDKSTSLKIYDLSGRVVLNAPIHSSLSSHSLQQLANGIYTAILFQEGEKLFTQKVVKI